MIEKTTTLLLTATHVLTGIFFIISVVKGRLLVNKAQRWVHDATLTKDARRYGLRLSFKIFMTLILLSFSFSRIKSGFEYVSGLDMWLWVALSLFFLGVSIIDFIDSFPENH